MSIEHSCLFRQYSTSGLRCAHPSYLPSSQSLIKACARQGSYGQTKEGYHCHWNNVDGDFHSIDEVLAAHGLQPNEYF